MFLERCFKENIVDISFKCLESVIFIILFIVGMLTAKGIIEDYRNERTSMLQSREPITEHPAISICFDEFNIPLLQRRMFEIGTEINITYYSHPESEPLTLQEHSKDEIVQLERLRTCYKITNKASVPNSFLNFLPKIDSLKKDPNITKCQWCRNNC